MTCAVPVQYHMNVLYFTCVHSGVYDALVGKNGEEPKVVCCPTNLSPMCGLLSDYFECPVLSSYRCLRTTTREALVSWLSCTILQGLCL